MSLERRDAVIVEFENSTGMHGDGVKIAVVDTGVDTDELGVSKIYVNEGPREKRVRPAPMPACSRLRR